MDKTDKLIRAAEFIVLTLFLMIMVGAMAAESLLWFLIWSASWTAGLAIPFLAIFVWFELTERKGKEG